MLTNSRLPLTLLGRPLSATRNSLTAAAQTFACAVLLAGCSAAELDPDKYQQIQAGMSLSEVTTLLGEPTQSQQLALGPLGGLGGLQSAEARWEFRDQEVIVRFVNDQSTIKELRAR